MNINFLTHW